MFGILLAGCGGGDAKSPTTPTTPTTQDAEVFTPGNTFSPFSTTIAVGATVKFNITGVPHNVIFVRTQAGAPADINVVSNVVVSRTFATRGTFPYDCTVHPGMSGQVVVQ
jgi:plastocyanin